MTNETYFITEASFRNEILSCTDAFSLVVCFTIHITNR